MSLQSVVMTLSIAAAASLFGSQAAFAEQAKTTTTKQEPPVTVTVTSGDTLSSIAEAHRTTYIRLFDANDFITNPDLIDVDQVIRIPTADEQLPDRYGALVGNQAPAQNVVQKATASTAPQPTQTRITAPSTGGNTYAYGWCTWYVKSRKPNIPNSWGNAYSWVSNAQASGYQTGRTPVAGAIGASGGHVVYVESTDGINVSISEMAYAGGVGVVHYRTVPASSFYYIYA